MGGTVAARVGLRPWLHSLLAAASCAAMLPAALAQPGPLTEDAAIARALGNGVHAFFGGDYQRAYEDLSDAAAAGSRDPRTLYFRGLAARRMGRIDEAEADFSQAAMLEASSVGTWPVSQTLERVQGQDRLALERHRVRSRIAVLQGRREAAARRYSEIESVQDSYLRRTRPRDAVRDPAAEFERGAPAEPIMPRPLEGDDEAEDAMIPEAEDAGGEPDAAAPADPADNPFAEPPADSGAAEAEPEMVDEPAEREPAAAEAEPEMAEEPAEREPAEREPAEEPMADDPPTEEPAEMAEEEMAETPPAEAPSDEVFGN